MLFFDLGLVEEADRLLDVSKDRPLLLEDPGLYYGAAGWGLANLWFWARTGTDRFLSAAHDIGQHLLTSLRQDEHGVFWQYDGKVPFGLGHGQSGIALFLTYLHAASANRAALDAAKGALQFELAHAEERENLLLWYQHGGVDSGPLLPYTRFGTAGFGAAALRYSCLSGDEQFLRISLRCAHAAAIRNSSKLWQDFGLAGFGELLLDFYQVTGDINYLNNAFHTASGILPSRITRAEGFAFAGYDHLRISCDVGMGSAGIGMFLHRLLNPQTSRLLFPDDLLAAKRPADEHRPQPAFAMA
jgi:lantibiotic modifying enzyme